MGSGFAVIVSSSFLMLLAKLYLKDIHVWLSNLTEQEFINIVFTYLKIQLLFGLLIIISSSLYIYYISHIKSRNKT